MNISPELIQKFFEKRCTEEEAIQVSEFLKNNPDIAEQYLPAEEWAAITPDRQIPAEYWQEAWTTIRQKKKRLARVVLLRRVSIAAAILIALGGTWYYFALSSHKGGRELAATKVQWRKITDTTDEILRVVLQDSSIVELMPKSDITYEEPFPQDRRIVRLNGEARFKVVRHYAAPFSVISGDIATTALGTEFSVIAYDTTAVMKVKLYEGKVVVTPADSLNARLRQDYYLAPGDEFDFNRQTLVASLIKEDKAPAGKDNVAKRDRISRAAGTENSHGANWYMFNNESLTNVFAQLESIYNVKISYDPKDLAGKNYIGRIEKGDSITSIINDICILNKLSVVKNGNVYLIKKK